MDNIVTISHKEWDMILNYIDFLIDVENPCHKCPEVQKKTVAADVRSWVIMRKREDKLFQMILGKKPVRKRKPFLI